VQHPRLPTLLLPVQHPPRLVLALLQHEPLLLRLEGGLLLLLLLALLLLQALLPQLLQPCHLHPGGA
jgi:hypothetical protein